MFRQSRRIHVRRQRHQQHLYTNCSSLHVSTAKSPARAVSGFPSIWSDKLICHIQSSHYTQLFVLRQLKLFLVLSTRGTRPDKIALLHGVPKNKQNCFCQNFVKSAPHLIIFDITVAKTIELCEVHSLCTSFN